MKQLLLSFTVLLAVTHNASAQTKSAIINGKVISFEESFPIEGVSLVVKGTKNFTGTQADGTFTLTISPQDKIIVISLTGYETLEVKITKAREYEIVLRRSNTLEKSWVPHLSIVSQHGHSLN